MDEDLRCHHCGHVITQWMPPEPTPGERRAMWVADRVSTWWFPTCVLAVIAAWVVWNVVGEPFEPYPVIVYAVMSAVLASVAALQGPLILTAQQRAAQRDRLRDAETLRAVTHNEAGLDRLEAKLDALATSLEGRSA